jgi:hypothetical protein
MTTIDKSSKTLKDLTERLEQEFPHDLVVEVSKAIDLIFVPPYAQTRRVLRTIRKMGILALPGEVVATIPPMVSEIDAPKCMSKTDAIAWVVGWNGCREAMLAALKQEPST